METSGPAGSVLFLSLPEICLEVEADFRGGTCTLGDDCIPLVGREAESAARHERGDAGMVENKTILVVEDDALVLGLTSRLLRAEGYVLLQAANGKEAIQIARDFHQEIHLVVTDVIMPELSGKELVVEMAALRPDIKVLYITGYPESLLLQNGSLTLNDPLLPKPYSAAALRRKVREILEIPEV